MLVYKNPFFDYLFGVAYINVPSKRVGYKQDPITKKVIGLTLPKGNQEFEQYMKSWLSNNEKYSDWPCKGRLLMAIQIALTKSEYKIKDIDNLAKTIIDSLKGVAYIDDVQIDVLHIFKNESQESSFFVGLKKLPDGDSGWFYPPLFDKDPFLKGVTYYIKTEWQGDVTTK